MAIPVRIALCYREICALITIPVTNIKSVPASLEIVFNQSLPGYDKKEGQASLGFPVSYYEADTLSPSSNVLLPSISVESSNRVFTNSQSINYVANYGTSGTIDDILFTHQSVTGNVFVKFEPYTYTNTSTEIKVVSIEEDSAEEWFPTLKNGVVYKDIIVTQQELDYSVGVTGSSSWLATAGFVAGDRVRVFYTLPQECFINQYSSQGKIFKVGDKLIEEKKYNPGIHLEKGEIILNENNLTEINKLEEISIVGQKTIFSNQSITDVTKGLTYEITQVNLLNGNLTVIPPPIDGALVSSDYKKDYTYFSYKGFKNEKTNRWIHLNMNPSKGHYYANGITDSLVPSYQLINKSVVLYLLPSSAIKLDSNNNFQYPLKYVSAFNEGGKDYKWSPLRHFVKEDVTGTSSGSITPVQSTTWGYGIYDVSYYEEDITDNSLLKGIPLYQNSALLLGVFRVNISQDVQVEDARRFSGLAGSEDRKENVVSTAFWDLSSWEGITAPLAGTVLVEVDETVLNSYGYAAIEAAVKKQLPPGINAIIRKRE
jgi:hypothetical protein